jgi:Fic family protein
MLRPFTDANGRCGRALWMWQVMRGKPEDLAELARLDLLDAHHPLNSDAVARSTMM